jgi:signal transduction histidine kinase
MENLSSWFKTIAIIFVFLVTAEAISILLGWYFNIGLLKNGWIGTGAVNPVTAINFILLTISLVFFINPTPKFKELRIGLTLLVAGIGLIRLAEFAFDINWHISEWLFAQQIRSDFANGKPNAIAPNTALLFVLLGISLLSFSYKKRFKRIVADIFACIALLISSLSVIGSLYRTPEFYFINSLIPMVLATAVCFSLFSLAILFYRSDSGLFRLLTSPYQGSKIARYLLPLAIVIPIAAGALSLYGQRSGMYSPGYGTAMFSMVTVVLMVLLIWQSAVSINKSSMKLVHELEITKQLSQQLQSEQQKAFEQALILTKMKLNQQLIEATINGQEKEKKQMGMELHDHINQILASTKLYIEMANTDEVMRGHLLQKSREQLSYAMSEIRNLSKSMVLHSEATGGIRQQMYEMVAHIQQSTAMNISMKIPENMLNLLEAKKQVAIYRIVEEQLSNIIKHANARQVNIQLLKEDTQLHLYIEDNGRGFDPEIKRRGIGLSNIQSRTEMLHGQLEVISNPGKGCKLKIIFPEITENCMRG